MTEADPNRDPLEVLATEFIGRQRSGQSPSISEYAAKHPELAAEIEDLFPAIAAIEQLKVQKERASGPPVTLGGPKLERLGDFRILGEIGRGGMGIVYEAYQESLGRHVAVKVLPRQLLLDPKHLQRFQRESQTAARLHHTNIVPVFGIGEQDGFHYIVMQLIRGVGLDAIFSKLQQAHPIVKELRDDPAPARSREQDTNDAVRLAEMLVQGRFWQASQSVQGSSRSADVAKPEQMSKIAVASRQSTDADATTKDFLSRQVTQVMRSAELPGPVSAMTAVFPEARRFGPAYWRSIAAIGLQVAEALHYAHAHSTLHRDIKPANLLLDSQGVVWITDFGLAKAMEQDNVTQTGTLVGTLRYMAPEQFSGRFDARGDIYGLGLTLYEMLALRSAFEDTSRSNMIHKITHDEPIRPRKFNSCIPRDLETIVLKAIARDPAHRYQSAQDLARDLQCFLEDRPIQARRASALERIWRWSRRNRVVAGLGASTLALLILVAVVACVGYVRTRQANADEAAQRKKAENTSALALEALDNIFQQFAPDRIPSASALTMVDDTGKEITVPVEPVLSKEAAALLERMLAFYDRLAAQGGDDAILRRKVAEANRRVGDIRQRLGHYEESKPAYFRAIELYKQLAETPGEDTEPATEIARIQNELGNVHRAMNEEMAGRECYMDALATLKKISPKSATSAQYQYELARTYYYLVKGPDLNPVSLPIAIGNRRGPGNGPDRDMMPPPGPGERRGSGNGPGRNQDPPRDRRGDRPGPSYLDNPGRSFPPRREQDPGMGEGPHEPPGFGPAASNYQSDAYAADYFTPFSDNFQLDRQTSLKKAIALLQLLAEEHPDVPAYRHLLARCYREAGIQPLGRRTDSARETTDKALKILQKLVDEHPDVPDYRYDLIETYAVEYAQGPFSSPATDSAANKRSREMLSKALAISEELVAEHPNIPDYAVSQVFIRLRLASILQDSDRSQAESHLRKALDLQSALVRRYPKTTSYKFGKALIYESLAGVLEKSGSLSKARTMLQASIDALTELSHTDPKGPPIRGILAHHYMSLADLLRRMGETQAATEAETQARNLRPGPG
jgi:serine/threonine protein kinase